jgi:hypothetical protein
MKLILIRNLDTNIENDPNLIASVLLLKSDRGYDILECKENLLYLAPEGTYLLKYEYSPKFGRDLWELYGISKRTEIKFHFGLNSRNSRGCILLRYDSLNHLHSALNNSKNHQIQIINF